MTNEVTIDLSAMQGKILSGRDRGKKTRIEKGIEALEAGNNRVIVIFPVGVLAISSSFFLGMLGPSILAAGSKERFQEKYILNVKPSIKSMIDGYIDFALQNKNIID